MRRTRWILLFTAVFLGVIGVWLWWVKPVSVDMVRYAPADSLLYLGANRPSEVVDAITRTQAWQSTAATIERQSPWTRSNWMRTFIRWTGIGPINSVIL